ncbi:YqaJ viral recombinase family protein [Microbacterium sp. BR1]|uniref:YqaJ viral recombinase family protein n=1 Tax=Microbacterium sp. BR1 TaxID=1070896 RepID=UPI000C2C13E3|nr:YqaJ viral recombinase family protein [Microbacterium sp. BR1]
MITADRFLAAKHISESEWLRARRFGVTATAVAEVAAKQDRAKAIDAWMHPEPVEVNGYMQFGTDSEAAMMQYAHQSHGILPVDWVIAGANPLHRATPDGLSLDHALIGECKAPGDPWDGAETNQKKIPIRYRRQVQFQLHVTGAERCLFLWNQRVVDGGWFRLAWFEPRSVWIERDEAMISDLAHVADLMLEVRDEYREAA